MKRSLSSLRGGGAGAVALALVLAAMACGNTRNKGSLVIGLQTDVAVPDNVDGIGIAVSVGGQVKYSKLFSLDHPAAPGKKVITLPATIAVVEPNDGSTPAVEIRAVAFHQGNARIVRDVVSTIPHGRTALLRLPLAYLGYNDGVHGSVPVGAFEDVPPKGINAVIHLSDTDAGGLDADLRLNIDARCSAVNHVTNVDGECADPTIDSSTLPDYDPTELYERGLNEAGESNPEPCFDVERCFVSTASTHVDLVKANGECSVPLVGNPDDLNVAMTIQQPVDVMTPRIGFCVGKDKSGGDRCMVPIDRDDVHGFRVDTARGKVLLPMGVCDRPTVTGIELSHASGCTSKTALMPIDGAGATCLEDGNPGVDAGVDTGTDVDAGPPVITNPWVGMTNATQVAALNDGTGNVVFITKDKFLAWVQGSGKIANNFIANASPGSPVGAAFVGLDTYSGRAYATFNDSVLVYATFSVTQAMDFSKKAVDPISGLSGGEALGLPLYCNDGPCIPDNASTTDFAAVASLATSATKIPTSPFSTAYAFALDPDMMGFHGAYAGTGETVIANGTPGNLLRVWGSANAKRAYGLAIVQDLGQPSPTRVAISVSLADGTVHLLIIDPSAAGETDVATLGKLGAAKPEPFLMRNLAGDAKGNVYFTDDVGNLKVVNAFTLAVRNVEASGQVCPVSLGVATDATNVYRACSLGVTRNPI